MHALTCIFKRFTISNLRRNLLSGSIPQENLESKDLKTTNSGEYHMSSIYYNQKLYIITYKHNKLNFNKMTNKLIENFQISEESFALIFFSVRYKL